MRKGGSRATWAWGRACSMHPSRPQYQDSAACVCSLSRSMMLIGVAWRWRGGGVAWRGLAWRWRGGGVQWRWRALAWRGGGVAVLALTRSARSPSCQSRVQPGRRLLLLGRWLMRQIGPRG